MNISAENAIVLNAELNWLATVIDTRIRLHFTQECSYADIHDIPLPDTNNSNSNFTNFLKENNLGFNDRVILLLALAPHLKPQLLDVFFIQNVNLNKPFTEFGGKKMEGYQEFLPTGETVAFVLAGDNLATRFSLFEIFDTNHFFSKKNVLRLENKNSRDNQLSNLLILSNEYLRFFTTGVFYTSDVDIHFPAKLLKTELEWGNLVLDANTFDEIEEIKTWITYKDTLLNEWGLKKNIKPGYRVLFYGTEGTGKKLTASLIGKATGLAVYRINLSALVSKYINETERNIDQIFTRAENKNWILFFDEADALFTKRTGDTDNQECYPNKEIAFLLQRIEDFPGLIILSTNLKSNCYEAFIRRFQSSIHFPVPSAENRGRLWPQSFSGKSVLEAEIDLNKIATEYELTGGNIINVVTYSSLMALKRGKNIILYKDIITGINKELAKEGK